MDKKTEELIYRSFDGVLNEEEKNTLEEALNSSEELRSETTLIAQMRDLLSGSKSIHFPDGFADKVVERVKTEIQNNGELMYSVMKKQFRTFAIAASLLAVAFISFNVINNGEFSINSALGIEESAMELAFDPAEGFLGE